MKNPIVWLITVIAVLGGGCCGKQGANPTHKICAQGVDKQAVMDTAQKVLEDMHFVIEKADMDAGYISTRPLAAGQFFELWRSDTVGCRNFAEANIHSITHKAEINITAGDDVFYVDCKVDTRRLSIPHREVSSATELPRVFTKNKGGLPGLTLNKEQRKGAVWIDMGPDTMLEAKVLEQIKQRIEKQI